MQLRTRWIRLHVRRGGGLLAWRLFGGRGPRDLCARAGLEGYLCLLPVLAGRLLLLGRRHLPLYLRSHRAAPCRRWPRCLGRDHCRCSGLGRRRERLLRLGGVADRPRRGGGRPDGLACHRSHVARLGSRRRAVLGLCAGASIAWALGRHPLVGPGLLRLRPLPAGPWSRGFGLLVAPRAEVSRGGCGSVCRPPDPQGRMVGGVGVGPWLGGDGHGALRIRVDARRARRLGHDGRRCQGRRRRRARSSHLRPPPDGARREGRGEWPRRGLGGDGYRALRVRSCARGARREGHGCRRRESHRWRRDSGLHVHLGSDGARRERCHARRCGGSVDGRLLRP
mmetsp:Transcript_52538/g.153078  ORF Transcript_52538/g.153078 Transcript_52538/m.153078 type:complete len:338 (-) Transcript_52538:758-1771(-)